MVPFLRRLGEGLLAVVAGALANHLHGHTATVVLWIAASLLALTLIVDVLVGHLKKPSAPESRDEASPPGDRYMNVIQMNDSSHISDSDVRITLGAQSPPAAPPQISTTAIEAAALRTELNDAGQRIVDLLTGWPLSVSEAMERSGISEIDDAKTWRRKYDIEMKTRYGSELRPTVVDVYGRARRRGLFNPEIEELYETNQLITARSLGPLLIDLSQSGSA